MVISMSRKGLKVLLIAPSFSGYYDQSAFTEPLGLCYLAAVLEEEGHQARIIHQVLQDNVSDDEILLFAMEYSPDCIGISTFSENYGNGLNLSRKLKKILNVPIIFGGVHASTHPEIAHEPSIDGVVLGQGVQTFPEILARLAVGDDDWLESPWTAYLENNELKRGTIRLINDDVDSLPIPKRDDLPIEEYKIIPMLTMPYSRQRLLSIFTVWGCTYNRCRFCLVPKLYGGKRRARSAEKVLEEMVFLKDRFDVNFIHIADDDFCEDRERTILICQGMIEKRLKLKFGIMTRLDCLDHEILDLMEEAGLIMMSLGIETGTNEGLKKTQKGISIGEIQQRIELTRNRRIHVNGNYIIGFPWDTRETLSDAFRFILSLHIDTWGVNFLIPFRGTKIREIVDQEGLLENRNLSRYSYKEAIVRTRTLSRIELEQITHRMIRRYYFRWQYMRHIFWRMVRYPMMIPAAIEIFLWGMRKCSRFILKKSVSSVPSHYIN